MDRNLCQFFLCLIKLAAGILSGSIAVIADAVNNLSDTGSAAIALIGFKLANKPADDQHPFGHGRLEYVAGLVISILIIAVGLNFLKTSFEHILHPVKLEVTLTVILILLISIPVKLWMFFLYKKVAHKIASTTIHAVAFDSLSDILTSSLVIVALVVSQFTTLPIDGCVGVLVACFIVAGGIKVVQEIINPLLGECPDKELVQELKERLLKCKNILGVHDIMIHSYGPNRYFATAHAEVLPSKDAIFLHDTLEAAEVEIARTMPIRLLLHCDPFSSHSPEHRKWRTKTEEIVNALDSNLKVYDFRVNMHEGKPKLDFNLLVPRNISGRRRKSRIKSRNFSGSMPRI
jgi:cation diffusion facilitator family transporter